VDVQSPGTSDPDDTVAPNAANPEAVAMQPSIHSADPVGAGGLTLACFQWAPSAEYQPAAEVPDCGCADLPTTTATVEPAHTASGDSVDMAG
jgi:hypothetical protein